MKVFCLLLVSAVVASAYAAQEKTCDEKPESGHCLAYFRKFYYDSETGTCTEFVYGGCGGNGNRYNTEEECLQNCGGSERSDVDLCSLEAETGPCRAYFESYFFNSKTGKCEKFIYGGCRGNENRFATEDECYNRCSSKRSDVDLCSLEAETGPCRARLESYFFNSKTGKCEKFIYGGCRGNDNRFATEDACYNRCAQKTDDVDVCSLESDGGMCRGYFPMYYFDSKSNECKEFIYGGCGGNENRFASLEDCYNKCSAIWKADNGCTADADSGPCRGKFPRYFFNTKSGSCEEFIYGGCRGNSNNYKTYEECSSKCGSP